MRIVVADSEPPPFAIDDEGGRAVGSRDCHRSGTRLGPRIRTWHGTRVCRRCCRRYWRSPRGAASPRTSCGGKPSGQEQPHTRPLFCAEPNGAQPACARRRSCRHGLLRGPSSRTSSGASRSIRCRPSRWTSTPRRTPTFAGSSTKAGCLRRTRSASRN